MMALVFSEIKRAKLFQRSLSSFWAEIYSHVTLRLKEEPRLLYAHRDFHKLRLDFPGLGGYFDVPDTVNNLLLWLGLRLNGHSKTF